MQPVFEQLMDVCYHASMTMEEGRPTVFRVVLVGRAQRMSAREKDILPFPTRHVFNKPVPFTPSELRRLAPVADPRRVLIAVEQGDKGMQIYGLVDVGLSLWEMARHQSIGAFASPDALIVTSSHPGELNIFRGDKSLLRLRNGEMATSTSGLLYSGPIAQFFHRAADMCVDDACQLAEMALDKDDDGLMGAYESFIEKVLLYTAELQHGGTILFVPDDFAQDDPRLVGRASVKYVLNNSRPKEALVHAMAARLQFNALEEKLLKQRSVSKAELSELEDLRAHKEYCEDAASDSARFIASLTTVDGAVILTDALRIIGFGAEVTVAFHGEDLVHVSQTADVTNLKEVRFDAHGTRHRSAFRFVGSTEPSVGFILSQDGGVKAVRKVGSKLIMWPNFELGYPMPAA